MNRLLRLLARILHPERTAGAPGTSEDLRRAIEVASEAAPRLRYAPRFAARLADAAAAALEFGRALAAELGQPEVLDKGAWDRAPLIPLIATTVEQGFALLRDAEPIRRILADPAAPACHFLLAMERREIETFGYEQHGEILHKDVRQTAVGFENHRVIAAARTGQEVKEQLVEHVLRSLAGMVPAALERAEKSRTEVREALEIIRSRVRTLELQLREEEPRSAAAQALEATLRGHREQAAGLEQDLTRLPAPPTGDREFLNRVREVLLHPRKHLPWTRVTLRVQDFGVLVREGDETAGREVSFLELAPEDAPAYALFFARLGREAAPLLWPKLAAEPAAGGDPRP